MGVDDFFGRKTTTAKKGHPERFSVNNFFPTPKREGSCYLEATKKKQKNTLKTISIHFTDGVNGMVYVRFILDHFP